MSDARCRQTFDGYRCRKPASHKGHHYADTTDGCGVGWGNLREDGYPNDVPTEEGIAVMLAWVHQKTRGDD